MTSTPERVQPFRGLLYNREVVGALAPVVAPPYDLIGPARQTQLYDRSPYNVVRLELNRDSDRYESSARMLHRWIEGRVLVRAPKPAIYFYTQVFSHEGRRLRRSGFAVRFLLEEFRAGRILPHERTFRAAKEDRLRLLTATQTNLSSIFGLYSGEHQELDLLRERVATRAPIAEVTDELGIENYLCAIEQPEEIAIVQRALADGRVLIADGHHRYETALEYRKRRRAADSDSSAARSYDYVMMTLVACNDPGLVILPTHRVVRHLKADAMEAFAARAAEFFNLEECSDSATLRLRLADAGRGALGVAIAGQRTMFLMRWKHAGAASRLGEMPDEIRQLDVTVLHTLIFERIFGLGPEEVRAGDNIEYTIDGAAALEAVASGRASGAFLMNPPTIRDVERVSDAGATMPEKSTYFYPKLLTGLVMNPLSD